MSVNKCSNIRKQEIINYSYVCKKDIQDLYDVSLNQATKIMVEVEKLLIANDVPCFNTRPRLVPIKFVLKMFPVEASRINAGAKIEREILYDKQKKVAIRSGNLAT